MQHQIQKIYIWQNQVRPVWWQPDTSRTLLYLPLSEDTTDKSWNNVWTTNSNVTIWVNQWISCWYFNWTNAHIQITPFAIPSTITILHWTYCQLGSSYWDWKIFDARSSSRYLITVFDWYNNEYWYSAYNWGNRVYTTSSANKKNQRILTVITVKNWEQKIYVKWNNTDLSWSFSQSFSWYTPTYTNVWNEYNNGAARYFKWYISNLIVENKVWTSDEINDYYELTKWNYWIS